MDVTLKDLEDWYSKSFRKPFQLNLETVQLVAEGHNIDPVLFALEGLVKSNYFSSGATVAKNYYDIKEASVGDQLETLKVFKSQLKGLEMAARIYQKKPFSDKAIEYKKAIAEGKVLKSPVTEPVKPEPEPQSGWNDKTIPDGSETPKLELEEYQKYIVAAGKWLAIGSFVVGSISLFVPQLRATGSALKALNLIVKAIKNEIKKQTKKE